MRSLSIFLLFQFHTKATQTTIWTISVLINCVENPFRCTWRNFIPPWKSAISKWIPSSLDLDVNPFSTCCKHFTPLSTLSWSPAKAWFPYLPFSLSPAQGMYLSWSSLRTFWMPSASFSFSYIIPSSVWKKCFHEFSIRKKLAF